MVDADVWSAETVRSRRDEWVGRASMELIEEKEVFRGRWEFLDEAERVSVGLDERDPDVSMCVSVVWGVR